MSKAWHFRPDWRTSSAGATPFGMLFSYCVRASAPTHGAICVARARCVGTFGNYLSYVRAACHANGYEAPPVGHPAIKRAMVAIVKRQLFTQRPKRFIQRRAVCLHIVTARAISCPCRPIVMNMVLAVNKQLEQLNFAMLWLVSYTWLLRLPSEVFMCFGIQVCTSVVNAVVRTGFTHLRSQSSLIGSCEQADPRLEGGGRDLPQSTSQKESAKRQRHIEKEVHVPGLHSHMCRARPVGPVLKPIAGRR